VTVRKGDPDGVERPDVEIGASVRAKRMRFKRKPEAEVKFRGELRDRDRHSELETASGSERKNLPREVEPGVTYRDVRVRWRAAARIKEPEDSDAEERG
jgi:hypothetical protein